MNEKRNCGGDHPVYSRWCVTWRKEKEILAIRYARKLSFLEVRKMVQMGNGETVYSQVVATRLKMDSPQEEYKYRNIFW